MGASVKDPITLEVVHNALLMAVLEMKGTVLHTAYSPLWKESGDMSCAVLTTRGEMVAQAQGDIPMHFATMPMSLQACLAHIPVDELEPGDVIWQNDPYQGNNHLPDILMAAPVFAEGVCVAFAAVRGHYVDIGGSGPGSANPFMRDLHGEGLRIPPMRLYRRGEMNRDILNMFLANVRGPEEILGDLRAQFAGCHGGRRSVERLAGRHGARELVALMDEIVDHGERLTRAQIRKLPKGRWEFTDHCDVHGEPIRIQVAVTIDGADDSITVDFTGSDPERPNAMNAPFGVTSCATLFAIKCITDPWNPANTGSYRPVRIIAPAGSVVNCRYPRAVGTSNHETAFRLADAIFGALAPAIPDRIIAAGAGGSGPFILGGVDPRTNRRFIYHDVTGAGQGAARRNDGRAGIRVNAGNMSNTPVEAAEYAYPIFTLAYELAADSGGAGTYRGACAMRRTYRVDAEEPTLTLSMEREHFAPYGLFGGQPGARSAATLTRDGMTQRLPSKTPPNGIQPGDVVSFQCAGSGGFGDPLERDPERVLEDVRDGYVSRGAARDAYGVDVRQGVAGFEVDVDSTRRRRAERRERETARVNDHRGGT
jgi:N-methylhydantoinase B